MSKPPFLVHRRAMLWYNGLTRKERRALKEAIAPLLQLPEDQWTQAGAIRLGSAEPLYVLRIDDSIRAFVRPVNGQPEIEDFVHQETIDLYFKDAAKPTAGS